MYYKKLWSSEAEFETIFNLAIQLWRLLEYTAVIIFIFKECQRSISKIARCRWNCCFFKTQCWSLKTSHTFTTLQPFKPNAGSWNFYHTYDLQQHFYGHSILILILIHQGLVCIEIQENNFVSHCRNICGVGQHLFSFCSTDDVCRHQSRANLSRFLQSRELFIERQLLQRLSCAPFLFHLIFLSHIFQMLAIIWTYAEKYTICWD